MKKFIFIHQTNWNVSIEVLALSREQAEYQIKSIGLNLDDWFFKIN